MLRTEKLSGFDAECVLAKGISLESVPGPTGSTVLYIQPCASVEGRVNCELRFGIPGRGAKETFYDFTILSRVLNAYNDKFAETRVSSNLGVARIQWQGKKILISRNGRIVIREALDEEDAKATMDFLSKLLAPSIICDRCGQVLVNCATASCGECAKQRASFATLPVHPLWTDGVQGVGRLTDALIERRESLEKDVKLVVPSSSGPLSAQADKVLRLNLDLIVQSGDREELVAGIVLLRHAWDLSLILELLDQVHQQGHNNLGSFVTPILRTIESWLIALKESTDGIVDERARRSSITRWPQFHEAWSRLRLEAENSPRLKTILNPLFERWPM